MKNYILSLCLMSASLQASYLIQSIKVSAQVARLSVHAARQLVTALEKTHESILKHIDERETPFIKPSKEFLPIDLTDAEEKRLNDLIIEKYKHTNGSDAIENSSPGLSENDMRYVASLYNTAKRSGIMVDWEKALKTWREDDENFMRALKEKYSTSDFSSSFENNLN